MKTKRLHSNRKQMKKNDINFNLKNIFFFMNLVSGLVTSVITFESLPLNHYLCEDSISFTCAYGAPVVVVFFLRKTMVLTYHS